MADVDSSLAVRTLTDEELQVQTKAGTVLAVSATDLDIRDLDGASDSVAIGDGSNTAAINSAGTTDSLYVSITDGTNDLAIDGSGYITANVNGSVTVTASDLDIRDLVNTQDSIAIGDATNIVDVLTVNSAYGATPNTFGLVGKYESSLTTYDDGDAVPLALDSNGKIIISNPGAGQEYTEDVAAPAAATGIANLMERVDTPAAITPAAGDWSKMYCNANGSMWVAIDGSVTVTASDLDIRDLTSVSDSVEVLQSTASNLNATVVASDLDIRDLASTQDEVAIGDGTNQLDLVVINSAYGATPVAMPIAGKYEATPTTYDDGDAVPLLVDENGRLQIDISSISGIPSNTDDSAFTIGSDLVSPIGALADETAPDSVDEGDIGLVRMGLNRVLYVQPFDGTNKQPMMDAAARAGYVQVTDGTNTQPTMDANTRAGYVILTDGTNDVDIDASGYLTVNVNGSVTVTASDLDIRDLSHTTDSVAIGDGTDTWSIDGSGFGQVDIAAQSLTAVKISKDANANSETNPIWVKVTDTVSGAEQHDYDTAAAVASDASSNHDYTVTATKTFLLKSVIAAASGAMKIEIQVGPVASLATVAVAFTNAADLTEQIVFDPPVEVPDTSTGTIRVIRTNRENKAMDVYSTIIGSEV